METLNSISVNDFEKLFREHYSELCGFANHIVSDLDEAEEIVQNLFVKLWEDRQKINISSFRSYLFKAVRNACYNQQKHLKIKAAYAEENEREMKEAAFIKDDELENNEREQKIQRAIQALPDGRKEIFILSRFEGLKYREISERLKISIKTVENQMSAALKQLKLELAELMVTLLILIQLFKNNF